MQTESSNSNAYSLIIETISAPNPPVKLSSYTTNTLLVFEIELIISSVSKGHKVLKSIISISKPEIFAASMLFCTN